MNNDEEVFARRSPLERHIQTIIVAASMAILSWVLLSVLDIRDRLVKFEERLSSVQATVNAGTDDRFRGQDWRIQKERLDERFTELKNRVDKNTERLEKLERIAEKYHGVTK